MVTKKSDVDSWLAHLKDGGLLPERTLRILCEKVKEILINEANVQPVSAPVVVCGNINGMFSELLHIFDKGGWIPDTRYIFMGSVINQGYMSCETFQLLICLKLKYPDCITLLRGNQESRQMSKRFGFYNESLRKYTNINAWKYCCEVQDYFGLAAVIEGKIYCVHAGLSHKINTLDQTNMLYRVNELPDQGPIMEMLWNDPDDIEGWDMENSRCLISYGSKVVS